MEERQRLYMQAELCKIRIHRSAPRDVRRGIWNFLVDLLMGSDLSEAQEGDPKYIAPELMDGKFGKPADVFRCGKRRRREYVMKSVINSIKAMFFRLLQFVFMITSVFSFPVKKIRERQVPSSSSHNTSYSSGYPLDHSISDDDCFEDDISIHNNSVGAPLDSSSSSDGFSSEFIVPSRPMPRHAFTTPAIRHRSIGFMSAPMSSSPVLPGRIR
ncbi:PKMYT [Mytilus edulis]|uniref:PKMYT n=1 Tax=Mytilus edulis TaxID=6550 RepID=A0A8S3UQP2_MYTED|nr:PKMYT [Mytilus edulis]